MTAAFTASTPSASAGSGASTTAGTASRGPAPRAPTPRDAGRPQFHRHRRYAEARRVLDAQRERNARGITCPAWPTRGLGARSTPCRTPPGCPAGPQQHRVPHPFEPDAEPRPDLQHPDHLLLRGRRHHAVVLVHDPAQPAVQLLLRQPVVLLPAVLTQSMTFPCPPDGDFLCPGPQQAAYRPLPKSVLE